MNTMSDDMLRTLIKSEADTRQVWNASPDLREEFGGSLEAFQSYLSRALALTISDTGAPSGSGLGSQEETFRRIQAGQLMAEASAKLDGTGYPDEVLKQLGDDLLTVVWDGSEKLRADFSGDFHAYKSRVMQLRAGMIKPTVAG